MGNVVQITVAINSEEGAHNIADTLVAKRLASSVWVSGPIRSTYRWEGKAEHATEWMCTIKTRADLYASIEQTIKALHPYEIPGILVLPVTTGNQEYLNWIEQETQGNANHMHEQETQEGGESSKEQLVQELIAAHEQLIGAATDALRRGATRTADAWGPREILAHMAGWEAMAVSRIPRIVAGIPLVTYETEAQRAAWDDAINATVITMIGDQSFDAICGILRKMYQADAQIILELDESIVRPGSYVYERTKAAIDHCCEHIRDLMQ